MMVTSLLATVQALDQAQRGVDPMKMTMDQLRTGVANGIRAGVQPNRRDRYEAIMTAEQMAELREDPAFAAALLSGEVEIIDRPLRAHQRRGGAYLGVRLDP